MLLLKAIYRIEILERREPKATEVASCPGFVWCPQISLTPTYDDNIYALPSDTIADWVWVVSPTLSAESQWDTHRIRLDAGLRARPLRRLHQRGLRRLG